MPRVPWPPILLAGVIVVAALLKRGWPIGGGVPDSIRDPAEVVGWTLVAAAALVEVSPARRFRRAGTTVLPNRDASSLVTSGLHARSRNPIYVAHVSIAVGLALATWNPWLLAGAGVLGVLLQHLAIVPEERFLAERFGDEYAAYRQRVRRWL